MMQARMKQVSFVESSQRGNAGRKTCLHLPATSTWSAEYSNFDCDLSWSSASTDLVVAREDLEGDNFTEMAQEAASDALKAPEKTSAVLSRGPSSLFKPINFLTLLVVLDMIRRWLRGEHRETEDVSVPADPTQSGWEPFAKAAAFHDVDRCKTLLAGGHVKLTERDLWGSTLLHLAASEGSGPLVALLLEHGAEVDALDASDETPLHVAARSGSSASCELLLDRGAVIDSANMMDQTPLLIAARADDKDACTLLLRRGAGAEVTSSLLGSSLADIVSLAAQSSTKADFARRVAEVHSSEVVLGSCCSVDGCCCCSACASTDEDEALSPSASLDSLDSLIARLRKWEERSSNLGALELAR